MDLIEIKQKMDDQDKLKFTEKMDEKIKKHLNDGDTKILTGFNRKI